MDENKNPESMYDMDDDEGATTVLSAPGMNNSTNNIEDDDEGATTVLSASDSPFYDESEGATTVLSGPAPMGMQPQNPAGGPAFQDRTVLMQPQPGNPMGGPMPNGPMGGPMPNGPMGGPMPNGPMGGPMPNGPMGGPMPNGPMGGPMPNGPMGGPMPNNGQFPPVNGKSKKPPKQPKQPKQPKMKDGNSKKKKTGWIIAVIVVVVLLALGAGAYFLFFTPEKRYERKMNTASEAMEASKYEEAEDAYEDALDIFDDRVPAMNGLLEAEINAGENEDARENFTEFRKTISAFEKDAVQKDNEEKDNIVAFYEYAAKLYSDAGSLIEIYKEGYDLTADETLKAKLVDVYVKNADNMDNADYEEKLDEYNKALELDGANQAALDGIKSCAYAVLDGMMESEQFDEAETFINTYSSKLPDVDFTSYTEKIESERALMNARHDLMEQVISLMAANDYEGMLSVDGSENASLVVDNMDGDSYVYAQDGFSKDYTGKAVGIYKYSSILNEGYYFYYGDYENGVRSGQGTLYVKTDGYNKAYTIYEGAWADDKPNGQGKETKVNESAGDELVTVERSGNLADGLFDGEVSVSLVSTDATYGGTYTGTFTATKGEAPDIRANYPDYDFSDVAEDKIVYVVLTCEGSDLFWHFTRGSQALLGIYGFGN